MRFFLGALLLGSYLLGLGLSDAGLAPGAAAAAPSLAGAAFSAAAEADRATMAVTAQKVVALRNLIVQPISDLHANLAYPTSSLPGYRTCGLGRGGNRKPAGRAASGNPGRNSNGYTGL